MMAVDGEFINAANAVAESLNKPTSKLARRIALLIGGDEFDPHIIDVELLEVREVLALVADGNFNQAEVINRARTLSRKLAVE